MKSSLWGLVLSVIFVIFWINLKNEEVEVETQPEKSVEKTDVKGFNPNLLEILSDKMTSPIAGFDSLSLSNEPSLSGYSNYTDSAKFVFMKVARASFKDSLFLQSRVFYELYTDLSEDLNCEQRSELSSVYANLGFEDKALGVYSPCAVDKEMTQENLLWLANLYFKNDSLKSAEIIFELIEVRFELSDASKSFNKELLSKLSKKKILFLE